MAMNFNAVNVNNNNIIESNTNMNICNIGNIGTIMYPITTMLPPLPIAHCQLGSSALPSLSCSSLKQLASSPNVLQIELEQKTKHMKLIENAYWTLKADFDKVCDLIAKREEKEEERERERERESMKTTRALCTINEEDDEEQMKEEMGLLRNEAKELKDAKNELKRKNREINKKNNGLEKEVKNLKYKLKRVEKENRKLSNLNLIEQNRNNMKQNALNELYLSSNRVKEFMSCIKKYGDDYKRLKKRQMNLTKCIGKEDNDTFRIRMSDLYQDIVETEASYHQLYEALDVIKTESEGKEMQLITKDKEHILLLEKEKLTSSSHLEEYVKKNQSLQNDLTDREMKLRQTQNEVAFVKQKLNRIQIKYNDVTEQLNSINIYNPFHYTNYH